MAMPTGWNLTLYNGGLVDLYDWEYAYDFGYYTDTITANNGRAGEVRDYIILTYDDDDVIIINATGRSVIYSGWENDTITGHSGVEVVFDGSGNDEVNTGGGNDEVYASLGDDSLDGGTGSDWLLFSFLNYDGFGPYESNTQAVFVDLAKSTPQNFGAAFGTDTILNFENVDGGQGNDVILGNASVNTLLGNGGNDQLFGRAGNDRLYGEFGADTMVGGSGGDFIYCGNGIGGQDGAKDIVRFNAVSESGLTVATRDTIYSFDRGGTATDDRIDLAPINGAAALLWKGTGAFSTAAAGEVRYQVSGGHTFVFVDTDADTAAEMSFVLYGLTLITAADFIL